MQNTISVHFILYVADQDRSKLFYEAIFGAPCLHVPGMTEFEISEHCVIGLMPEAGIKRLLGDEIENPSNASGIPRAEIYLRVSDAELYLRRASRAGARELSPFQLRNWGDFAAYFEDPDGHILAFAHKN
jgi:predicted enzyme related to lactoylglutathione lyase